MNLVNFRALAGLALIALVACGGGGSSSSTPAMASSPITASQNTLHAAPLSSSPGPVTAAARRRAKSVNSQSVVLIDSTGTAAIWSGDVVVWVTDANGNDVLETSATTSTTNGLEINSPAIEPLGCGAGQESYGTPWCIAHPDSWVFGTSSGLTKPLGQQTITVTFGDGATGKFIDDVYDGWQISCGQSLSYISGVPTIVTTNPDVIYDCANSQFVFPHGVVQAAAATQDQFGLYTTAFASVLSPVSVPNGSPTSIPGSFTYGTIYVFATGDGGFAKIFPQAIGTTGQQAFAMSLYSATGTYAY